MASSLEVGPRLDPKNLPALPPTGVAVEVQDRVVFVGLDGTVHGHIDDFQLDFDLPFSVGLLAVSGGQEFAIDPGHGTVRGLRGNQVPLAAGARLSLHPTGDQETHWTLDLAGGRRVMFPPSQVRVSVDHALVTSQVFRIRDGFARPVSSRVVDTASGATVRLPPACWAAERLPDSWVLACWPSGPGHPSWIGVLGPRGGVRRLVPAPRGPGGQAALGHWEGAEASPDGSTLLLQWSGECEVPTAYLAPASGGRPRAVVHGRPPVESVALGWAPPARLVVSLPQAACGAGFERPGVYVLSRSGGSRLVYETNPDVDRVVLWRRSPERTPASGTVAR
ncbi:MAG: hypothetical protein M3Q23_09950 [Actinomycetota bacterium]|nr:hypothetical protein [Actinomycetota bacterium]